MENMIQWVKPMIQWVKPMLQLIALNSLERGKQPAAKLT